MVTENDFIDGLRSGDQIKFGQFMRKHIPALTFHAYKICGDKEVSEEIVADAFTKLWNLKENFENETKVKAFLFIISLDNSKAAWINAIEQDGLPWIHVSDLKGWKNEVATLYDIRSVPQNFLIDPEGKIIAKNLRGDQVSEVIAELLK